MRKTFLKVSILGMLTVGMAAGFTSCKDYDDDIKELNTKFDALQKDLKAIQDLVSSGVVITNVSQNADGVTITMSNNQTYNITNGKDGAPGKDADVWTIVEKDGKYMWAKNGEVTEFPAQGPAGTAVAGSYYVPNAETGVFDEHKADGTVVPTTIPCFAKGSLTAVDDGNNIIISGILDANGKETAPFILSKTGALSSLEFIPDLYVDGIETMETEYLDGTYQVAEVSTKEISAQTHVTNVTATIAKDQIINFEPAQPKNNDDDVTYDAISKTDANYLLNPANANLSGVTYKYITNDAEVRPGRASEAILNINSTTVADGTLTVNYSIADRADIKQGDTDNKTGKDLQTVAALQATLKDGSVVSSNFVALNIAEVEFKCIQYSTPTQRWAEYEEAPTDATQATRYYPGWTHQAQGSWSLPLPYDKVSNLPDYLRIAYTSSVSTKEKYYTLAEIAAKYGYTMSYSILDYTVGTNTTSESMYATVSADGKFQPMYVNAAGQSVPTTTEAGRSAIGRQPIVILQLKDAEGNLILGGFVKVVLTEKATEAEPINLGNVAAGYTCGGFKVTAPWDVFAGQVVEATGMSVTEFWNNYTLQNTIGIVVDGEIVEVDPTINAQLSEANEALDPGHNWNNFGKFSINGVSTGSQTQEFTFTISPEQAWTWYPEIAKENGAYNGYNYKKGDQIGVGIMSKTPVTKTIYAKFYNYNSNSVLWVGYTVTMTGVPTITYDGKNPSTWIAGKDIVPVSPAVANNAPAQNIFANVISVNPTSLWLTQNGQPNYIVAAPYQTTDSKKTNYFTGTSITYTFAETQPQITTNATMTDPKNASKQINIVYGFIGDGNVLYGVNIMDQATGEVMTGKPLADALNAAKTNPNCKFAEFDANNNDVFTITEARGMVDDVINANAFSKTDPKTLFNVEMNVTYGNCPQLDGTTGITVKNFGGFQVGVGRPINVAPATTPVKFVDGSGNKTAPLNKLANVVDWQGNTMWTVSAAGVASLTKNAQNMEYWGFWMGSNGKLIVGWEGTFNTEADLNKVYLTGTKADMSDAQKGVRHGFTINFNDGTNSSSVINVDNMTVLNGSKIVYEKYGDEMSTVTSAFYVFVPIQAEYVWGKTNIGYAAIQIDPTKMPAASTTSK